MSNQWKNINTTREPSSTHLNIKAAYRMTTLEVFREVAVRSIRHYGDLEVLGYAWNIAHQDLQWPSWIPRWDISNIRSVPKSQHILYNADRQHTARYHGVNASNSLAVNEIRVGAICDRNFALMYLGNQDGPYLMGKDTVQDTVAVVLGYRVPVILRKYGSAYHLVSDAYVDGFIDGEAIDRWQSGDLELRNFEII